MRRVVMKERQDLEAIAQAQGFRFMTMYGEPYWDETSAYEFRLKDVENGIEDPATELHAMVREAVGRVVEDESLLARFALPTSHWDLIRRSWRDGEAELYGRFDLVWDGVGDAKLLEYNADTPTSLFETASFQWGWLSDLKERGQLAGTVDQFNGLHEALTERFETLFAPGTDVHFTSARDNEEDYATVEALAYAARDAGLGAHHVVLEDIGLTDRGQFADGEDRVIGTLFKLYPWEDLLLDPFAERIEASGCRFIEPAWKAIASSKALLPILWSLNEGHPNLLPAFFAEEADQQADSVTRAAQSGAFDAGLVRKPIYSREGASITITRGATLLERSGNRDYDHHPQIIQAYHPLPRFEGWRPVIGAWVVGEACVGMGLREDRTLITQDLSRFKPHYLID